LCEALLTLSDDFDAIYAAALGRPLIPPDRLLRACGVIAAAHG
jgi:hypothetical protein